MFVARLLERFRVPRTVGSSDVLCGLIGPEHARSGSMSLAPADCRPGGE
jgi:hypothetical protein